LRDFHKICRVCTLFQDALAVKTALDFTFSSFGYCWFTFKFRPVHSGTVY